jgi:LacI family transcriptional regulator
MVTIKHIADLAGVSFTTVSHVLNGTRPVSEPLRQRVLQAAEQLHYVPSAIARGLRQQRTLTVGAIVPNCSNPYFAETMAGVEAACYAAGFSLILCNCEDDAQRQQRHLRVLAEKQVDGLLILSSGGDDALGRMLLDLHLPQVVVDRDIAGIAADRVQVDHRAGARLAVGHLLEAGRDRIACITGPLALSPAVQRREGFLAAMQQARLPVPSAWLPGGEFSSAGGHAAMLQLLRGRRRPSAVFACNDLMAIGALSAAQGAGLRVPQDLAIVGFDDIALAAHTSPPLTTVAQPKAELGQLAARMLIERITQRDQPARTVHLQPVLKVRSSSAEPA